MALTSFNTKIHELSLMQSSWAKDLDPVLSNPIVNGILLKNVSLTTGVNRIPHKLNRNLIGWIITRNRGPQYIYDQQDSEQMPAQFLKLYVGSNVKIDLYVF